VILDEEGDECLNLGGKAQPEVGKECPDVVRGKG